MKAMLYDKKAEPYRLVERDIDRPEPKRGELRVRVKAVSINGADWRCMKMGIIPRSRIFGADISGIVDAAGPETEGWKEGDEVVADLSYYGFGGFAEYVCASAAAFVRKPGVLDFTAASAVPMAGVTALQALRDKGELKPGQEVLIVGSSGGVGTFAVQLASFMGARVTAVAGSANVKQALDLGAARAIDYSKEDFTRLDERFDLILAVHGCHSMKAYTRLLKKDGTCVVIGGALRQVIAALAFGPIRSLGRKTYCALSARSNPADLAYLLDLASRKVITPSIERVYRFDEIPQAMDYAGKGHAKGKLVIAVGE